MRLLVVEDDPRTAQALKRFLEPEGFAVDLAGDGLLAEQFLDRETYDAIVLDRGLPGQPDGMAICKRLRADGNPIPILILTAQGDLASRVEGLNAGADDYLAKPFAAEELVARVRALLRRPADAHPVVLRVGDLTLDTATRIAERGGQQFALTAREFAMLELFMRSAGTVLDRATIARHVWDDNYDPASNIIDVYVQRLRTKLDRGFPRSLIHTLRGQGYVCREGDE